MNNENENENSKPSAPKRPQEVSRTDQSTNYECGYCGQQFEVNLRERYYNSWHDCAEEKKARRDWYQLRKRETWESLRTPSAERVAKVLRETRLPLRTKAGLHVLTEAQANRAALQAARDLFSDWINGRKPEHGLYLHGPAGTGKTAILQALGFAIRHNTGCHPHPKPERAPEMYTFGSESPATVEFWPVADLFSHIKRTFDHQESDYSPSRLESCDLLICDDLGKTLSTPWNLSELFRLVDARYRDLKVTCFTSNYPPEELMERMASRLEDDLHEDIIAMFDRLKTMCRTIEVGGDSWRRRA